MGCSVGSLLSSYLGLLLCLGRMPKSLWNQVVEKVENKLASWKARYLSMGRRITLIHSALANLPVHFISSLKCPGSVIKHIDKLQRDFLWQGPIFVRNLQESEESQFFYLLDALYQTSIPEESHDRGVWIPSQDGSFSVSSFFSTFSLEDQGPSRVLVFGCLTFQGKLSPWTIFTNGK